MTTIIFSLISKSQHEQVNTPMSTFTKFCI